MDFEFSIVFDVAQFPELVHKMAHAGSRGADHLRKKFLTKLSYDWLRCIFFTEICKEKEEYEQDAFHSN